jgi:hypothetical protein
LAIHRDAHRGWGGCKDGPSDKKLKNTIKYKNDVLSFEINPKFDKKINDPPPGFLSL